MAIGQGTITSGEGGESGDATVDVMGDGNWPETASVDSTITWNKGDASHNPKLTEQWEIRWDGSKFKTVRKII